VKQKQGESASDKQKHRTAGGDTDSIRAAILEESVIVCKSNCLESGSWHHVNSLSNFSVLAGLFHPQLQWFGTF
jgi:hypothetical protein